MEKSIVQNIKLLKGLPNNWQVLHFKNVLKDVSGGNKKVKKNELKSQGKLPVVDQGKTKVAGYCNNLNNQIKSAPPHIVFGDHTRKLKFIDFPFAMGADGTKCLKVKDPLNVDYKYIYYFLQTINIPDSGYSRHFKYLKSLYFPIPPMEDQKKISSIIDQAHRVVQVNRDLIQKYNQLANSIFLDMFGDPVFNSMGHQIMKLNKLTTKIGSGATPKGGNESYKKYGINLIRSLNVHNGKFNRKNLAFIDEIQAKKLNNVTIELGDVLYNITGASVCRCVIVPDDIIPARVNQHVSILRCNKKIILPEYLSYLLISKNFEAKMLDLASKGGATREAITKLNLEELEIPVPHIVQQKKFSSQIQILNKQKLLAEKEIILGEELFQSILQKAFKGELIKSKDYETT